MEESELYTVIKGAKRKRFLFGYKPLYELVSPLSDEDLQSLESKYRFQFPPTVKDALLNLGASSIADLYLHPPSMTYRFDQSNGQVSGYVTFASDICGNYFTFNPESDNPEAVFYCSHDPVGYAAVAPTFRAYLESFVSSNFDTLSLTDKLELHDY